jgi:predicted nucleic acid-binding protein
VAGSILDTSVLIGLAEKPNSIVETAISAGDAVIPPLVVAELVSGAMTPAAREEAGILLQDVPVYEVDLGHWINVGLLRQHLRRHGLTITLPDAHIAQCAIERDAALITRDAVFAKIADATTLRVIMA